MSQTERIRNDQGAANKIIARAQEYQQAEGFSLPAAVAQSLLDINCIPRFYTANFRSGNKENPYYLGYILQLSPTIEFDLFVPKTQEEGNRDAPAVSRLFQRLVQEDPSHIQAQISMFLLQLSFGRPEFYPDVLELAGRKENSLPSPEEIGEKFRRKNLPKLWQGRLDALLDFTQAMGNFREIPMPQSLPFRQMY